MKKNILVTGSHRSGSTWTGKVIEQAPKVRYVQEPFNIAMTRKYTPLKYWFQHISNTSTSLQKKGAKKYLNSFLHILHVYTIYRLLDVSSIKGVYYFLGDLIKRLTYRTIIKDPIAIMSVEWIYNNYNIDVVVLIRHPAAFIASLKVKNWEFDFNNFLNQPLLLNSYLKQYKDAILIYSNNQKDIIDQGILLWNIIHQTIFLYQKKYKEDWYFVKHEDLSTNPMVEFNKMFAKLNLTVDSNVINYINETTKSNKKSELKRNSKENIKSWKQRLSEDEIQQIKIGTEKVWKKFYTENDW
ncbi:sulfotransferase [Winogradskyella endarachnes]|uniref:Uncharacterized protein n=1 Tax=Winogradskyella endarachnes TaxID=2681965 RepID=A0A6L6U817_9FLAO|nr:sulfotransferase [Winogradskyella endarachnes]MUU78445.1 hypothetical protein [Winogradskyella endarachnes]